MLRQGALRLWGRLRRADGGAVAIEFAIVSLVLVLASFGIVEFGRAMQIRNELSSVADRAARRILNDATITNSAVETQMRREFHGSDASSLQVAWTTAPPPVNGVQVREFAVSYPVTLLIPSLASSSITLQVERRVPVT